MEQQNPTVHLAIAFDEGYLTPAYVLLTSIFLHNAGQQIAIHAIASDVPASDKEAMAAYVRQQGGQIHFYELDADITKNFPVPDKREVWLTLATYYRLFFAQLVPADIERLLYLDIDSLVVGSLAEIYQADIGSAVIGAVTEAEMPLRTELGIHRLEDYFNAGILLMHLPRWREQHTTEQIMQIIAAHPEKLEYCDQDALNMHFRGSWHRLDSRYNLMKAYIPHDLAKRDYRRFLTDKVIIHYNGRNKPWHRACENKLRFLYPEYLRQSPRAKQGQFVPKPITRPEMKKLLYSRVLETYFNYPAVGRVWRRVKGALGKG
ncbi:glycosyltransferase family 8 protein [Hymenobacter sp. 5516J-16]|uniref:glycosyltransferase family 8 protein n=1 Tax=Hymenobacter sp. 5516J-16 TaxID=2932253 RepID=UPI001FD586D9|nr:glycosyltransferase family 8 protein [Hymenobacter sp. 5516J-16]UOQ76167.1 glycosyltransferase family 8 protein [Hymenobacter sp. 5516J-16]